MKKHDINSQNLIIMNFNRLYEDEIKNVILIKKLLKYCKLRIQKEVKTQEDYIMSD